VLFWQNGHRSNLIYGVPATGSIRNWIPIVMFAFLFGISMDYEVFILARMREEYDRAHSTNAAVVTAPARTGRLVTCGALILAISFASLSANPDIVVEMIATAFAAGILIDASSCAPSSSPRSSRSWAASTGGCQTASRGCCGSSHQPPRRTPPGHEDAPPGPPTYPHPPRLTGSSVAGAAVRADALLTALTFGRSASGRHHGWTRTPA
jgi:hypothetical protein